MKRTRGKPRLGEGVDWEQVDWSAHETIRQHADALGVTYRSVLYQFDKMARKNDLPLPHEHRFRMAVHHRGRSVSAWRGLAH